jgi:hypothetical protein
LTLLSKWSKFNGWNLFGSHRIYKSMPTLLPDRSAIKTLISKADVISVLEEAFRMCSEGKGKMLAKTRLCLEHGDFGGMPAGLARCAGGEEKW